MQIKKVGGGKVNRINQFEVPEVVTELINSYIGDFEQSEQKEKMALGSDYYRSENTEIMNRKFYIYAQDENGDPVEMEDPYKANNKLASGYLKILIDQKVNYLLGNEMTLDVSDDEFYEIVGKDFQSDIKKLGKESSKKAIAWAQVYIDENGDFGYKKIPTEQIIPVYSTHNSEELEMIIRYYSVTTLNDENKAVKVNRVEVWDDEQVTFYQETTEDSNYHLLNEEEMAMIFGRPYSNPKYHFQKEITLGSRIQESKGLSWGAVPFVPLYNNDEEDYDLQPVKRFIDARDIVSSDFTNNLEDFQDVYWILKGYDGENLNTFLDQVKKYKSLKVAEDGDARTETIDIPHEARKEALEELGKDIFTFGQGVNPNNLQGGSLTNVVIKSRFANLDLKADQFEDEIKSFIHSFLYFVNRYRELKGDPEIEINDITFDRSMMINEVELLNANTTQRGNVSEDTRLSNHIWVNDAEEEKAKMDNEGSGYNLDDVGDGDDGPEE
jgi:SPP1 family phage portal protein